MPKKASAKKTKTKEPTKRRTTAHVKNNVKRKRSTFKDLLVAISLMVLPLAVGFVSTTLTGKAMMNFGLLKQPPFTPPVWVFPAVWSVLYILMGVASCLIYSVEAKTLAEKNLRKTEFTIYFLQLIFNLCWPIFFFRLELRFFAFGWVVALWLMVFALVYMAFKNRKSAAWCLLPYLLWCTFAVYLNLMIAILN